MLAGLRGFEWIIILVIIVLLFGVGRISKISGEIGKSISAFRDGLKSDEKKETTEEKEKTEISTADKKEDK
jgi:sec-independent protein translocase protein TatA